MRSASTPNSTPISLSFHNKTLIQRQVEATDAAIDKLVYELYGLTEEEIMIIEGITEK